MRVFAIFLIVFTLTGCAGLSVNWALSATYTSEVPLGGRTK